MTFIIDHILEAYPEFPIRATGVLSEFLGDAQAGTLQGETRMVSMNFIWVVLNQPEVDPESLIEEIKDYYSWVFAQNPDVGDEKTTFLNYAKHLHSFLRGEIEFRMTEK